MEYVLWYLSLSFAFSLGFITCSLLSVDKKNKVLSFDDLVAMQRVKSLDNTEKIYKIWQDDDLLDFNVNDLRNSREENNK